MEMTRKSLGRIIQHILGLGAIMVLLISISCRQYISLENPDIIKSDTAGNIYVMKRYDTIIKFDRNNKVLFEIERKGGYGLDMPTHGCST